MKPLCYYWVLRFVDVWIEVVGAPKRPTFYPLNLETAIALKFFDVFCYPTAAALSFEEELSSPYIVLKG
jgi:hypothetical protein